MPSDLSLDLYDLQAEVGDFAGYGFGSFSRFNDTAWNQDQLRRINKSVNAGCRAVYFTQEMEDIPGAYMWSFLQPRSTLILPQGATEIALPADCNGLLGDIVPASLDGSAQFTIRVMGYDEVYRRRSFGPTQTGRPEIVCEQAVKGTTADRSNRYKLQVFPIPDADYTLQVWYEISPGPLSPDFPHPYGGAAMAETFKAAVRAAYELDYDGVQGPEAQRFMDRLRAAIAADRKHKPLTLGYNGDRSDDRFLGRDNMHGDWGVPFSVNGVTV